jgi:hypothetical protein
MQRKQFFKRKKKKSERKYAYSTFICFLFLVFTNQNEANKKKRAKCVFLMQFFFSFFFHCLFLAVLNANIWIYLEDSPTFTIDSMHKCIHIYFTYIYIYVCMYIWIHCLYFTPFFLKKTKGVSYAATLRYTTSNCATINFVKFQTVNFVWIFVKLSNFLHVVRATMYF